MTAAAFCTFGIVELRKAGIRARNAAQKRANLFAQLANNGVQVTTSQGSEEIKIIQFTVAPTR